MDFINPGMGTTTTVLVQRIHQFDARKVCQAEKSTEVLNIQNNHCFNEYKTGFLTSNKKNDTLVSSTYPF